MSKLLKLSPKQLSAIQAIEQQKQQLSAMMQDATAKQNLVVELAFEAASIDIAGISGVKLEGDCLSYEIVEVAKKPSGKKKEVAVAE